jgi:hypothetical protein
MGLLAMAVEVAVPIAGLVDVGTAEGSASIKGTEGVLDQGELGVSQVS